MTSEMMQFVENAAEESRYHAGHWFRYLRKIITDDNVRITPEEIENIIEGDKLTLFQKVSLKQAVQKNTPTNRYITGLNQRASTTMLREIIMRNQHV